MQTVTVDCSREEVGAVVRAAFERTDAIRVYYVGENHAIGKTGVGRVSWGERVVVEFTGTGDGRTELSVRAEREVRKNVTAAPETVESAVLDQLARARSGQNAAEASGLTDTREVMHPDDLPSGRRAALLFLGLFLSLVSVPAALLGANAVGAIASGSLVRLPLFLGLFLIWVLLVGGVGIAVTWYEEGTLQQRLPV